MAIQLFAVLGTLVYGLLVVYMVYRREQSLSQKVIGGLLASAGLSSLALLFWDMEVYSSMSGNRYVLHGVCYVALWGLALRAARGKKIEGLLLAIGGLLPILLLPTYNQWQWWMASFRTWEMEPPTLMLLKSMDTDVFWLIIWSELLIFVDICRKKGR